MNHAEYGYSTRLFELEGKIVQLAEDRDHWRLLCHDISLELGRALTERDHARTLAVRLEQELAEARDA